MASIMDTGTTFGDQLTSPVVHGTVVSVHRAGRIPPHLHQSSYVCVVLAGIFVDSRVDPCGRIEAGDAIGYPGGEVHENQFLSSKVLCLNLHSWRAQRHSGIRRRRLPPDARRIGIDIATGLVTGSGDRLSYDCLHAELTDYLTDRADVAPRAAPLHRVMALIADEPGRHWGLTELADLAGYHPTHLARSFRQATGMTIGTWRRKYRVLRLCADLRTNSEELAQLAYRHGFSDQAHMSREVRLYTGLTPVAVRKNR